MDDWKQFSLKKPLKAYSIFCGVLEYSEDILDELKSGDRHGFKKWKMHVNLDDIKSEKIIKGFNRYYYESFVNCIFPDFKNSDKQQFNSEFAHKTVRLSRKIEQTIPVTIPKGKSTHVYDIRFEYMDLFFFPRNIVFYCFKCDLTGFSFDEITLINSYLRNSGVTDDTRFLYDYLSFIESKDKSQDSSDALSFGNKLKVFSLVEHEEKIKRKDEKMLLYDLGVCAPIGSAAGNNQFFQPSREYFQELISENRISVFNNWSALTLFDTFTGLYQKGALNNFVWENGYFNLLYLQSLYVKHYLFKMNHLFHTEGANHQELEDDFYEFNKHYNPSHISYNFLPTVIFRKIRQSLAINDEIKLLKEGIERANQKDQEKRNKMINNVLTLIALLAIFSVIWDLSDWITRLVTGGPASYRIISGSLTFSVLLVLSIFVFKYYRKKS